jgi:tRNA threonylcarbamoyladenosine biosynthesis protein TsaB
VKDDLKRARLLLIDSAGERASVALVQGEEAVASVMLAERASSSVLVAAVRGMLRELGWKLGDLDGVGVVAGPGSFTGVRAGLAMAKGLCEAAGLRLAAVSRLEVLAEAAGAEDGVAALYAGRGAVYVREQGREWMAQAEELAEIVGARTLVVAEEVVAEMLIALRPKLHALSAMGMLPVVRRALAHGGADVANVDANYVRSAAQIYARRLHA